MEWWICNDFYRLPSGGRRNRYVFSAYSAALRVIFETIGLNKHLHFKWPNDELHNSLVSASFQLSGFANGNAHERWEIKYVFRSRKCRFLHFAFSIFGPIVLQNVTLYITKAAPRSSQRIKNTRAKDQRFHAVFSSQINLFCNDAKLCLQNCVADEFHLSCIYQTCLFIYAIRRFVMSTRNVVVSNEEVCVANDPPNKGCTTNLSS